MSIFKKAAPEPPAKVEPKGSAYDLDIEADGDDPATAATVVNALYAKYKKNVRIADRPRARAARIQRARADSGHVVVRKRLQRPFSVGRFPPSPRPRVPERRARTIPEGKRDESGRHDSESAGNPGWRGRRPVSATRRCHHRNRSFPRRRETDRRQTRVFHV